MLPKQCLQGYIVYWVFQNCCLTNKVKNHSVNFSFHCTTVTTGDSHTEALKLYNFSETPDEEG